MRIEAVKLWLATLPNRLTPMDAMARTVFAPVAVRFVPTPHEAMAMEAMARGDLRSEVDDDPARTLALEMGRLAVAQIEDRLVRVADDRVGEVLAQAVAAGP